MALPEGVQGYIYRGSINSGPSGQNDLKGQRRCNLGGGRELTFEGEHDMWVPWASRIVGGTSRPHMSAPRGCYGGLPSGVF